MYSLSSLLTVGALGATLLCSPGAGATNTFRKKSGTKNRKDGRNPRKAKGRGRCGSNLSIAELVVCASSDEGFDTDRKDFDILLYLVGASGIKLDDLEDVTVFLPNDNAFQRLAEDIDVYDGKYDEEAITNSLAEALTGNEVLEGVGLFNLTESLVAVLQYHVATAELSFNDLKKGEEVTTALGVGGTMLTFESEEVKKGKGKKNKKRKDRVRLNHNDRNLPNPKIQGSLYNIETSQGLAHVINNVLIPVPLTGE